jgi:hypothetical protein
MSTRQLRSTDKAIVQILTNVGYDLRMAEGTHKATKLRWLTSTDRSVTDLVKFHRSDCRRDLARQCASRMLQIVAVLPPARRREAWAAFRHGWRIAGEVLRAHRDQLAISEAAVLAGGAR